jgi:hypothetical protein
MVEVTVSKIVGLVIAIGFAVIAIAGGGIEGLKCSLALFLPLALIWFPDEIGGATGYVIGNMMQVDTPTPPILISMAGWFFLLGLPVIVYLLG